MQCVVLAGGLATRMQPTTERVPKWLLRVAGRPFAEWQIEWMASQGIDRVVAAIGHLGDQIQDELGDGHRFGVHIDYSDDGPDLVGTGGALRLAAQRGLLDERVLVLYGDSYLSVDVRSVWNRFAATGRAALMTVREDLDVGAENNASYSSGVVTAYSASASGRGPTPTIPAPARFRYIDYGLSVFERTTIGELAPNAVIDLADVFEGLATEGRLAGFEVRDRFYEVGSPGGLAEFEGHLRRFGAGRHP